MRKVIFILFMLYRKNKDRSLDCWEEVANFKQAVAEEQKKFIGTTYQKQ